MTDTLYSSNTSRVAASGQMIIIGDDGLPYRLFLQNDGTGLYVLSLEPYIGTLDGTRNFSDRSVGTAFYLHAPDGWHRFNMVSDGPGMGTYGLQDSDQSITPPSPIEYVSSSVRFDDGITMNDNDGVGTHKLTVTGGTLTQEG